MTNDYSCILSKLSYFVRGISNENVLFFDINDDDDNDFLPATTFFFHCFSGEFRVSRNRFFFVKIVLKEKLQLVFYFFNYGLY